MVKNAIWDDEGKQPYFRKCPNVKPDVDMFILQASLIHHPSFVVTFLFVHRASEHQDTPEASEQRPVTGSRQHAWCVSQCHRLHMELSSMCEPSPCTRVAVPALVPQSHRRRFLKKAKDLRGFELLAMVGGMAQ